MLGGLDGALEFMGTTGWAVVKNATQASWSFVEPKIDPSKKKIGEACSAGWCMAGDKMNEGWLQIKPKVTNNFTVSAYNTVAFPFNLVKNSKTW